MKRLFTLALIVLLMVSGLSGCGCDDGGNVSLVFVNDSDATIAAVEVSFEDRSGGARNADRSPMKRGDFFGFEAGEYPVTVVVYKVYEELGRKKELTRVTIPNAPSEGERWYVIARDGTGGLVLSPVSAFESPVEGRTSHIPATNPFLWAGKRRK